MIASAATRLARTRSVSPSRGKIPLEHIICPTTDFALQNTTSVQELFDPAATSQIYVVELRWYQFDMLVHIAGMSATSGNARLDWDNLGTTGGFNENRLKWFGFDASTPTTAAAQSGSAFISSPVVVAAVGTELVVRCEGVARPFRSGFLIPSIALGTAVSSAVVKANSYATVRLLGWPISEAGSTTLAIGDWT